MKKKLILFMLAMMSATYGMAQKTSVYAYVIGTALKKKPVRSDFLIISRQ